MESLWREETGRIKNNQQVSEEKAQKIHWDVIVVGAGMAGLLTAYYLKEEGKRVLVLEAGEIASGQTERTTAKITGQHGLKYSSLIKSVGAQKAKLYAQANEAAIEEYDKLVKEKKIDCRFERIPSYLYTKQDVTLLHEEAATAAFLGMDAFFTKETELPFEVEGAVCFRNQAQFAPLEFVRYISAELNILEHTRVLKIRGHKVITKDSVFLADKIVVATHYPMVNVPGFYFIRQHQERSYVLALSGCDRIKGMYYGIDKGAHSFRQAGEYLLLGGSSGRTGEINCGTAYDMLQKAAEEYYPDCKEVFRWAAQDCMPHDGIPFIGKYSVFTPHLYVATGFQKWGMTSSMIAATLLRDVLCGFENPYAALFSPQRINFRAAYKNLLHDIGMSAKGLTKGLFHKNGPRCSHMGCELVWNPEEKSWDCPCHGSRFTEEGKVLDNPAKRDLNREK